MSLPLLHSPADVIRWLLIQLAAGTDPSLWSNPPGNPWPVFATSEPSVPDNVMTVYDTTGQSDGRTMTDGEAVAHYGFQVRFRSIDPSSGFLKAQAVRRVLAEQVLSNVVAVNVGTPARYVVNTVARIGQVLQLGKEPSTRRSLFTLNALVSMRLVP